MRQHELALSSEVRVLLQHLLHLVVQVFHLVGTCHEASPVHASAAVNKNYLSAPFLVNLVIKISNKALDIVQIHKAGGDIDGVGDEGVVSEGIEHGSKDQFRAELSFLGVVLEIFLFDVAIFSLFGSEEVEEADHHQLELVKSRQLAELTLQLLHLELPVSADGQVAPH